MLPRLRTAWHIYHASLWDKRTPRMAKILPWLSLLYLIWPVDLIPDAIPLFGQMDDVAVIVLFCIWAFRMIPEDLKRSVEKREIIDVEARRD